MKTIAFYTRHERQYKILTKRNGRQEFLVEITKETTKRKCRICMGSRVGNIVRGGDTD